MTKPHVVIIGVGDGLLAAVARELASDHELTLAARSGHKRGLGLLACSECLRARSD